MSLKVAFILPLGEKEGGNKLIMSPFLAPHIKSIAPYLDEFKLVYLQSGFNLKTIRLKIKALQEFKSTHADKGEYLVYCLYGSLHGFLTCLILRKHFKIINTFGGSDLFGSCNSGLKWKLKDKCTKFLSIWTARNSDFNIVKCNKLFKALEAKVSCPPAIVPNGVNFQTFKELDDIKGLRAQLGWEKDEFVILFNLRRGNSSFETVKNYPLAQKVIKKLRTLERKRIRLEILRNKTHQEMNVLYNAADCLLLTSLHEGSPNIVKEAMACNLPIVTVNCGDVEERLRHVSNSYVSKTYDVGELVGYCQLVFNEAARSDGRINLVKQGLDSESVAKKIVSVLNSVAHKGDQRVN